MCYGSHATCDMDMSGNLDGMGQYEKCCSVCMNAANLGIAVDGRATLWSLYSLPFQLCKSERLVWSLPCIKILAYKACLHGGVMSQYEPSMHQAILLFFRNFLASFSSLSSFLDFLCFSYVWSHDVASVVAAMDCSA